MKKFFPAFIAALFILSCKNGKDETEVAKNSDWNTQNLKGHVKSYEETSYTPDSTGKIGAMDSCCMDEEQYDEKGYNNTWQSKDSKGNISSESVATRYDGGELKDISIAANGKKWTSLTLQIDKNGKYTIVQEFDTTGKLTSFYNDLVQDEYGSTTAGTQHNPDSSIKITFASEYNKGTETAATVKDSTGKVTLTYKAELDDKGNIVKSTSVNTVKDSTTTTIRTFKYDSYDDAGNWTQRTTYNDKGKATKVLKRTYTYYKKD